MAVILAPYRSVPDNPFNFLDRTILGYWREEIMKTVSPHSGIIGHEPLRLCLRDATKRFYFNLDVGRLDFDSVLRGYCSPFALDHDSTRYAALMILMFMDAALGQKP